ncbi:HlyD family efflux transporter periplasmic adaptor subunit [Synechococcus sp. Cruz-9H2]|uniref:HlyD family efflux transporter periplasmic adaptor subunit n=1 Tax=unclassified Synechococcus TaxID=2626047 RepID=UPI0020CDAF0A|nr:MULTISPECIES: HlyD family efflux transporter periplasmic adaptor subunit [unclassified Synechococcus]MCP9818138.1 HlyD family efflux transporter periplasmic adaptor subunit [Synechococcus sp. Cruz-9H2]MCP9842362.1 HlyD family efflux transporter periplasmic adaptor subunit [Synechococcus sp. Edmonson 11F2]MCP9854534.1 HlyD family efflux transporter periplasmic adaptor subunit [Synechococcus sp. Cruz-9C9]MCP9861770.1 HlyD family efflux transporter periplasmic adaptor subunit [Synechococcus sp.
MTEPKPDQQTGTSLVDVYERILNRLRSPRGRRRSTGNGFEQVVPVKVDLVGDPSTSPAASSSSGNGNGSGSTPVVSHPFLTSSSSAPAGTAAATSALVSVSDWSFNQPVLLKKSPRASSLIVWTAVGGLSAFGIWAVLAPLGETIAVQGKLQPGSKVKAVQAPVAGVIETVLVKDGQSVEEGDVLIRYDLRDATSKLTAAEAIRAKLLSENQILAASLGDSSASGLSENQQRQLDNQADDLRSRRRQAEEQLKASEVKIEGLRTSLATAENIAQRYDGLSRSGAVSEVQALENRNRANELRTQLATEERTAEAFRAALVGAEAAPGADLRSRIELNLRQLADLDGQIRQARLQLQYSVLRAPKAGAIFDIDISQGSVVEATQTLLRVVPADALEAKVFIPNNAIGYITPGQRADLSLETFPSTDFGTIPGKVKSIGSDALTTEEMAQTLRTDTKGLFYPAVLTLDQQTLPGMKTPIQLKPGMALTADIKLRQRSVISLFTGFFGDKRRDLERLR